MRLALGARPAQVAGLVVGQGLTLAVAGIGIGLAGAVGVARLLEGLLFSISATDPVVYASLAAACCSRLPRSPATFRRAAPCASIR